MTSCTIHLLGNILEARGSGTLWWPAERTLVVSDLHLGKSERQARRWGRTLPPYEVTDTLSRLSAEIDVCAPERVICLGDSFDDVDAASGLGAGSVEWISVLQQNREWIWVAGNHDPAISAISGRSVDAERLGNLIFRHEARHDALGEISGHYHPKARLSVKGKFVSRPCFLVDDSRVIMPAFGTFTGGLNWTAEPFLKIMAPDALAVLTGKLPVTIPLPQQARAQVS